MSGERHRSRGWLQRNPFNFQNFGDNRIELMRNGTFRPSQVYTSNFANGQYISVYMSFVQELDCDTGNTSVSLNRSELANGYTLYAFQITDGLIGPGTYGPQSKFATKCALECVIWCCSEKKISM